MNYKQLLIDNFAFKTSYVAQFVPEMSIKETKDYIAVDCGLPADTFNIITLVNNNLTVGIEKLYKEVDYYNQKNFPMSVWLWDEEQERDIKSELIKIGLKEAEQNIAMVADLKTISPTINMPVSFTIQQASSPGQIKKFGETLANLFGISEEGIHVQAFYNQISNLDLWNSENMKLFLGFYEGEVVTVGSLICSKDSIGIYDIATKEEMRGRGFGSTMFNFLLQEAQKLKNMYCVLQASPDGINIYKTSGFQAIGKMTVLENRHLIE
ncbi:GNAT family N-acetyltransferase [Bacillus thuringiensis]|uniref:N-acetyltransferase domain-containing protein n=1 Tax=Bacillus thuringiensis serovar toumanoffi TaxID=180862 RepID=A0ABD5I0V7_BACTU|nr:GNAT family N-acetyltransferase [Bacillus thuringiensis]EEM96004.1 Acetyltransferase [Bacillus thuringiensis IBL 200]MCR6780662.1 GNAT family N-acetyltransferase [Bacillus thuringiensis]MCR6858732.1 GNAT family N-acetyltransferase [Bacillus thuringiensis]MCR6866049.1 GNAT family N-acetyltransferase [Bacillus thuringiensis]MDW9210728.1 N-acetyltransferase domain-containing protein [Bacillus thuringiensis serovar toumanoffi]